MRLTRTHYLDDGRIDSIELFDLMYDRSKTVAKYLYGKENSHLTWEISSNALLAKEIYGDGNATCYGYNRQGEVIEMEDPRGVRHKYEYDEYGRQTDDIVLCLGKAAERVESTAPDCAGVKTLPAKMVESPAAVARFHREVKAAARLSHPNIVAVHDAREHQGVHFYVMELVEGDDLAAHLKQRGPLPIAQSVEFIRQTAEGLAYAHDQGVIHRDIKPHNLLLAIERGSQSPGRSGIRKARTVTVKILDLGLARIETLGEASGAEETDGLTGTGQVMGTAVAVRPLLMRRLFSGGRAPPLSLPHHPPGICGIKQFRRQLRDRGAFVVEVVALKQVEPRTGPFPIANGLAQLALHRNVVNIVANERHWRRFTAGIFPGTPPESNTVDHASCSPRAALVGKPPVPPAAEAFQNI